MEKRQKIIAVAVAIIILTGAFAIVWYYSPSSPSLNDAQNMTIRASDLQGDWWEVFFESQLPLDQPDYPANTTVSWIGFARVTPSSPSIIAVDLILMIFENESEARVYYESRWVWAYAGNDSLTLPIGADNILVNTTVPSSTTISYEAIFLKGDICCIVVGYVRAWANFSEYSWLEFQVEIITDLQYEKVFPYG